MIAALVASLALAAGPQPARVQVSAFDFEYRLSRTRLPAGRVFFELVNFGEDEHDLHVRRVGGKRTFTLDGVAPGERRILNLRLGPGRYRLWCHVGDHSRRGMTAEVRVVKRRPPRAPRR